jgi:hypothetical protein
MELKNFKNVWDLWTCGSHHEFSLLLSMKHPVYQIILKRHVVCVSQRQSVHINRVSPAYTLKNKKIKSLLSYFRGSAVLHTLEHSRTDQIKCIRNQLQPARRC